METEKKNQEGREADILFSRTIKAGQRIYYIDVKQNRRGEMYLCITESKKMQSGSQDMPTVNYEKHKIFLYREDFAKFADSLNEAIKFVIAEQGEYKPAYAEPVNDNNEKLNIDIDF